MEGWMDENFIKNVCQTVLSVDVQVKVIRDRNSGYVPCPVSSLHLAFLLAFFLLLLALEVQIADSHFRSRGLFFRSRALVQIAGSDPQIPDFSSDRGDLS